MCVVLLDRRTKAHSVELYQDVAAYGKGWVTFASLTSSILIPTSIKFPENVCN